MNLERRQFDHLRRAAALNVRHGDLACRKGGGGKNGETHIALDGDVATGSAAACASMRPLWSFQSMKWGPTKTAATNRNRRPNKTMRNFFTDHSLGADRE